MYAHAALVLFILYASYRLIMVPIETIGEPYTVCTLRCPTFAEDCDQGDTRKWCEFARCYPCIHKQSLTCSVKEEKCDTRYSLDKTSPLIRWLLVIWGIGVAWVGLYLVSCVGAHAVMQPL